MKQDDYQHDLSRQSPILLDKQYKAPKIRKMRAILEHAGVLAAPPLAVDVGCSGGLFVNGLAPHCRLICGMDIDSHALALAQREKTTDNILYIQGDSQRMPFPDNSVDLVLCNHVYEHVPDARQLFREIHRVLRRGGVCYLGAASRLIPVEPHYHLPFLSWLPRPVAHWYMRISGKGDYYYEKLRTYWGIRRLLEDFEIVDYTTKVLNEPDRFEARDMIPRGGVVERLPSWVWRLFYPLLPSYLFILRKP